MLKGMVNLGMKSLLVKLAVNSYKMGKEDFVAGKYDIKEYKATIAKSLKKKLG